FAALCLSVPYGDVSFRAHHLVAAAAASGLVMPVFVWLHRHQALYVVALGVAGGAPAWGARSGGLPPRGPPWVPVSALSESSELSSAAWPAIGTAALLVAPAGAWAYIACFLLWPRRTPDSRSSSDASSSATMGVPAQATCVALALASTGAITFAWQLPYPN